MKKIISKTAYIALTSSILLSCASTKNVGSNKEPEKPVHTTEEISLPQEILPTESELYLQKVKSVKLTLLSTAKETIKGRIFTSPYTIKVESDQGSPLPSFEISVIYPSKRENGLVVFAETAITSDADGKAEFLPPQPDYSFNSEISFYPKYNSNAGEEELAKIKQIACENTIKAPFMVQTNLKSAGGVIGVVDFNKNGKAITSNPVSSSNLLITLMKLGFTRIGNIDITNQVIMDDEGKILSKTKEVVGNSSKYLVYGTVKIDSIETREDGVTYNLTGAIKGMNLSNGEITFATESKVSVSDKSDWNALANARKALADKLAKEIKYGI
ncbi:MAG: hypothetical protein K5873_06755 [Treponema sp.]|nr:hypothetical protein [Treponema sp.]